MVGVLGGEPFGEGLCVFLELAANECAQLFAEGALDGIADGGAFALAVEKVGLVEGGEVARYVGLAQAGTFHELGNGKGVLHE